MDRFAGTVEVLAEVDASDVAAWIAAIPFADWHQQHSLPDKQIRPAMMTDLKWHEFGRITEPLVSGVMAAHFPGCRETQRMLSVVMPGHSIEPHTDSQPPYWICRVHVPLTSNPASKFIVGGVAHRLEPGWAYRVNTEAVHSVENAGRTPRTHFMWDCLRA